MAANKTGDETPTRIRSDIIDIKRKSNIVTFLKNVVIEKDDSSLLAEKMVVIYEDETERETKKKDKKGTNIKRIDAFGDVKIFSEEFIASGDYGHYDPAAHLFVLEKNVIVNNGTSIASGEKFVYNTKTTKSHFVGKTDHTSIKEKGGDKRVTVVIGSEITDQKKSKKDEKNGE